jgi:hypothetical protein
LLLLLSAAVATGVLFATDAFFGFSSFGSSPTRRRLRTFCASAEKREPFLALVAIVAMGAVAVVEGMDHPRTTYLAGGALTALAAHLVLYGRSRCLVRGFDAAPRGSAEWYSRAAKLDATMATRAYLQAAAFICIVAAALTT